MPTSIEIARFMAEKFQEDDSLSHRWVVAEVKERFGTEFLYLNKNNNWALSPEVLRRFKELTHGEAKWRNRKGRGYWYRPRSGAPAQSE